MKDGAKVSGKRMKEEGENSEKYKNGPTDPLKILKNRKLIMKIYEIYHCHDISYDQEQWKTLGFFSLKKKAIEALRKYKQLPGFKDRSPELGDADVGGEPSWEGGFIDGLEWLKEMHEKDGTILTITEDKEEEDLILEIPYWAKDEYPIPSESSEEFAHRLMQSQGFKNYPQAPESEFYQIKCWADNLKKYLL
ncbi:MAG: hypothetical protein AAF335_03880 [Bacteroidota bacterium]